MSALGHKPTLAPKKEMSALSPKADTRQRDWNVRFEPEADSGIVLKAKLELNVGERT
jgi:hypothetical protein